MLIPPDTNLFAQLATPNISDGSWRVSMLWDFLVYPDRIKASGNSAAYVIRRANRPRSRSHPDRSAPSHDRRSARRGPRGIRQHREGTRRQAARRQATGATQQSATSPRDEAAEVIGAPRRTAIRLEQAEQA